MGSLVVHGANLNEVLKQSIRCYDLFSDDIQIRLYEHDEHVELSLHPCRPELDPDRFLVEWLLLVGHRFWGWLVGY